MILQTSPKKNDKIETITNFCKAFTRFRLLPGYLLCKSCGEDTSVLNLIDNSRISDFNLGLSNITIGEKEILIQELRNPRGISFKVLISKRANCAPTSGVSGWMELSSVKIIKILLSGSTTPPGSKDSHGKFAPAQPVKLTSVGCSSRPRSPLTIRLSPARKASTPSSSTRSSPNHVSSS